VVAVSGNGGNAHIVVPIVNPSFISNAHNIVLSAKDTHCLFENGGDDDLTRLVCDLQSVQVLQVGKMIHYVSLIVEEVTNRVGGKVGVVK
jgi:hypothetical protein